MTTPEERAKKIDENWEIWDQMSWPKEVVADIAEEIRSAIAAQREKDAKIAEDMWHAPHNDIAAAIRGKGES